jgi:dipeptidyl aminopeptidase/acylaminoacyl peptidase
MPYNLLPNFGMAVLVLVLPGREGYGPQFYNDLANGTNYGQIDVDEGAQVVNQLIQKGWTSHGRVGITGCSYGGYFTTQSISRYPDLYAAANTQCTLLDLFDEWQFGFTGYLSYLEGRVPTTDPAEYVKDSPLYNAGKIRAPTLIFDGTRDFLPYTLSSNLHDQINANGVPADFLLFRNEGHGLSSPNSQYMAGQAQINWFRRYLATQ